MANTTRGKTWCPFAQPQRPFYGPDGEEFQQCRYGELITYDAKTFKEIRREKHALCDEDGMVER